MNCLLLRSYPKSWPTLPQPLAGRHVALLLKNLRKPLLELWCGGDWVSLVATPWRAHTVALIRDPTKYICIYMYMYENIM